MKLTRYLIAALLMLTSSQAMALFMPYDIQDMTDTSTSDVGCG